MSASIRQLRLIGLLSIAWMFAERTVFAGWMGFRNDTKETIVIQETVVVGGQTRLGRPQRLFAGEAVRDNPLPGGQRRVNIFDANNPLQPIYSGTLSCPALNENILYCIKSDGKGGLTIEAVKTTASVNTSKK